MKIEDLIKTAKGDEPADLLLTNAQIINVFSGEILRDSIAVKDGYIAGIGDYDALKTMDMQDKFIAPGLIDAHVHIESSMVCASEFARAIIPKGTTTVVADPHEIANVWGAAGIEYMLNASEHLPMNILFTLPSCVPATQMETSGAKLGAEDLKKFFSHERIVALAEMMNFPGVINCDPEVMSKIKLAGKYRKPVEGHSPGLSGKGLNAYLCPGISSDHECTTIEESYEKLRNGMHIMIREGTGAKNLSDLLPLVNSKTAGRIMWCTDDRHPDDINDEGHIDYIIRRAIQYGIDPITAIRIGTINVAQYFNLRHIGAIAPGRRADFIIIGNLNRFDIQQVYTQGRLAAENGRMVREIPTDASFDAFSQIKIDPEKLDFKITAAGRRIKVIELVPKQIITRQILMPAKIEENLAVADPSRDLLKIAVVERHKGTGDIGKGFVKGFGLQKGALASSVAHDSHNIIVVGAADNDMKAAVKGVVESNGGFVVACDGKIKARLPLPIAGLMSTEPLAQVRKQIDNLIDAVKILGCNVVDPFMTLSFLALPVIPELKLTDQGLFDVIRFSHVPLFVD